ncbi:MAG: chromate efflux transporter, partial [Candidatus Aminicenantales bacterium]
PGATAMQCAAYVGLRSRRWRGAVAAYVGFGLPAFLLMLVLAVVYQRTAGVLAVTSVLSGIRALVVALIAHAAWTFGRTSIKNFRGAALAILAAAAFGLGVNPILIILGACLAGALLFRAPAEDPQPASSGGVKRVWFWPAAIFLALAGGMTAALLLFDPPLAPLSFIAMKADILAFGGGFASVPLLYREIVTIHHWLPSSVFMDGIALGQVTPGPIVITATFIGYQVAGISGALVGTVGIFLPSIFVVLLAEPWFRRYRFSPVFKGITSALVLSFVGLLASVTIQFGLAVMWNVPLILIAAFSFVALLRKVNVMWVVLAGAVASAVFGWILI